MANKRGPDPTRGAIRWARTRGPGHLDRFVVGGVVFALASVGTSRLTDNPLLVVAGGVAAAILAAYSWALFRAPYEQRDALQAQVQNVAVARRSLASTKQDAALLQQQYFQVVIDREREKPPATAIFPSDPGFGEEWHKRTSYDRTTEQKLYQQFGNKLISIGTILLESGYGNADLEDRMKHIDFYMHARFDELVVLVTGLADTIPDEVRR